jgi:hypothetical protein
VSGKVQKRAKAAELEELRKKAKTNSVVLSNAASFDDLIKWNTHWADKTGFVKVLAKEREHIGFYFPRRFCKSTLLSMTHFFLNKEVGADGVPLEDQWTEKRRFYRDKFRFVNIL